MITRTLQNSSWPVIGLCLLLVYCQNAGAPDSGARSEPLPDFSTENFYQLGAEDEPGTPLLLLMEVVDRDTGSPLPGDSIFIYHTNNGVVYEEKILGDPYSNRLGGWVVTDPAGRLALQTILPGTYPDSPGANRHIHTSVKGARPEAYDIFFEGFVDRGGRRWAANSGQGFIARLEEQEDGSLNGWVRMEVGVD